jgi:hypothetical protein
MRRRRLHSFVILSRDAHDGKRNDSAIVLRTTGKLCYEGRETIQAGREENDEKGRE